MIVPSIAQPFHAYPGFSGIILYSAVELAGYRVNSIAEQLNPEKTWTLVLAYAFRKLLRLEPNRGPIPVLIPA